MAEEMALLKRSKIMGFTTSPRFRAMALTAVVPLVILTMQFVSELSQGRLPELVKIANGEFMMGTDYGIEAEKPVHRVVFADDIYMSKTEITFEQYDSFVYSTQTRKPDDEGWGRGTRPVINVSWWDAHAYARWLGAKKELSCNLPTEAEWEYAARAGTTTRYSWGNDVSKNQANCKTCGSEWDYRQTAPVGSFAVNPFGLHDMHGNVWEWVLDCLHDNYENAPSDGRARHAENGGRCKRRLIRGGSWSNHPVNLRSTTRSWGFPDYRSNSIGFRVVCRPH